MTSPRGPVVLGVETSCDETGIGIVIGDQLCANVIASSIDEQARFGGVVPEVASRAHVDAWGPALDAALAEAEIGCRCRCGRGHGGTWTRGGPLGRSRSCQRPSCWHRR